MLRLMFFRSNEAIITRNQLTELNRRGLVTLSPRGWKGNHVGFGDDVNRKKDWIGTYCELVKANSKLNNEGADYTVWSPSIFHVSLPLTIDGV